jgi:hypothetical protein
MEQSEQKIPWHKRPEVRAMLNACRRRWQKTPKGKAFVVRRRKEYKISHPVQVSARNAVYWAVNRSGKLTKPDHCERCGLERKVQAHHHDYTKKLEVT